MTSDLGSVRKPESTGTDRAVAALIFATLYIIYLVTMSGAFRSIDELAMYSMTESLVQRGDLSTPQINFNQFHNPVGRLEPAQAILTAPLYWIAQRFAAVNNIQAVLLITPLITALTAAVLYRIGRQLDYDRSASIGVAFAFGLATIAWPYTRTFLREPLLGLIVTLALYAYTTWKRTRRVRWIVVMLVLLAATLSVKFISFTVIPFFVIPAFIDWIRLHPHYKRLAITAAVVGAIGVAGIAFLLALFRYDINRIVTYLTGFRPDAVLTTVYGMLLSPGKGIIFYAPIMLAAWIGLARAKGNRATLTWISGLAPLGMILAYGNWGSWFGGQAWGPRFLVPAIPLMIFPLIERMGHRSTWVLFAISFALQLGPVTTDWTLAHKPLLRIDSQWETGIGLDPSYWYLAPSFNMIRFWTTNQADLTWAHRQVSSGFTFDPIVPIGLLAVAAASVILLRRAWREKSRRAETWAWPILTLAATVLLLNRGWDNTPDSPGLSLDEARAIAAPIASDITGGQTFITVSNEFRIYFMLGFMKGSFDHDWDSPAQHTGFDDIKGYSDPSRRVTLTIDRVHLPPEESGNDLRDWLNQNAYQYAGGFVGGGYERMGYVWGPDPDQLRPAQATFGDRLAIDSAGIGAKTFRPGGVAPLQVTFRKLAPLPDIVIVVTQLAGDNGIVIGGNNGPIQFGTLGLSEWPIGTTVIDRRGFPIPADTPPGTYQIRLGFETSAGVLKTKSGEEFWPLGQIQINP